MSRVPPLSRLGPMASSALLLILAGSFFFTLAEGKELAAADALGCPETTVRVVATENSPTLAFVGPRRFTDAVSSLAADLRLSVAFSPDNVPDLITLLDRYERFTVADDRVQQELAASTGSPAVAVSTFVAQVNRPALLPQAAHVVGEFSPTVSFDGVGYPAVLYSPEAAPFSSGVYLVAGADPSDLAPVRQVFERNGMQIQNLAVQETPTLASRLGGVYGGIVISLAAVLLVGALLTAQIHASFARSRLVAAAVLGATRRDLWVLVLRHLVPQVLAGFVVGAVVCLGGALGVRQLLLSSPGAVMTTVSVSVGVCAIFWSAILTWVAAWETVRCRRAVLC